MIDRVVALCARPLDERELRTRVLAELRPLLDFDAYAWLLTDPLTWVGTAPLAEVPELRDLQRLIALKYRTRVNRWTDLPPGRAHLLSTATGGRPDRSLLWRELLSTYGVVDVASMSFCDRYGSWGFLDLWRCGGTTPFTTADVDLLNGLGICVTAALRRAQARLFAGDVQAPTAPGPRVLVLDDHLRTLQQTAEAASDLRRLLPTPAGEVLVPAAALNVAAQLLAVEEGIDGHDPSARVHLAGSQWVAVRASRLADGSGDATGSIAVTIESLGPHDRADLFARASALAPRERQLLHQLLRGSDNAAIASTLAISVFTVQDHLKSIFDKTGCRSRGELVARAAGGS